MLIFNITKKIKIFGGYILNNSGIKYITLGDDDMAAFYEGKYDCGLVQNQYLFLKNINGEIVDKFRWDKDELHPLKYKIINNPRFGKVKPLNDEQVAVFDLLQDSSITVKVITGVAGSGKTMLTLVHALDGIEKYGSYKKLILIRNNIEVKDTVTIGALPSGLNEKLLPFAMPVVDILGSQLEFDRLLDDGKVELVHLGFVRGRNFDESIIVVDECQNLTADHVALLVSRVGKGSVICFLGDSRQSDKPVFEKNSGLERLNQRLFGNLLAGHVHLTASERSATSKLSELLY